MENADPNRGKDQETGELLTVIIDELRSIGLILARQDERIEALSKVKDRARPAAWESLSVAVGLHCTEPSLSTHTLPLGIRESPLNGLIIFRFYGFNINYNIY
jgi:hypothetical protein